MIEWRLLQNGNVIRSGRSDGLLNFADLNIEAGFYVLKFKLSPEGTEVSFLIRYPFHQVVSLPGGVFSSSQLQSITAREKMDREYSR